jgi:hypothetical protein
MSRYDDGKPRTGESTGVDDNRHGLLTSACPRLVAMTHPTGPASADTAGRDSAGTSDPDTHGPDPAGAARPATGALLANSALAFVLAAMVNDTLHELGHAVAGVAQGQVATLTPFAVGFTPEGTVRQQVVTAAAGPLLSLVLGLGLMLLARSWGRGVLRLFFLWLAFMAVMNFVGYLFIAPFASVGDTGQILRLLAAPGWVYGVVAVLGVAGQFWLAYRFAGQVRRYAHTIFAERRLSYLAWIVGTVVVVALTLVEVLAVGVDGATAFVVVFYSCAIGIFAPMQFLFHSRFPVGDESLDVSTVSAPALALTVIGAAALIALAFSGGVRLG